MARKFVMYENAIERSEFLNENEQLLLYLMYRLQRAYPEDEWFGIEDSDVRLILNIIGQIKLRTYFDTKFAGILEYAYLNNDIVWLKWYPGLTGNPKKFTINNPILVILADHLTKTIHIRNDTNKRPAETITNLIKHIKKLDAQCMD